jgi:hypothetical protein
MLVFFNILMKSTQMFVVWECTWAISKVSDIGILQGEVEMKEKIVYSFFFKCRFEILCTAQ